MQPVDREARTLGWVDAPSTTLQMWAPSVRAKIPRVQSLPLRPRAGVLRDLTGKLRVGQRRLKSARGRSGRGEDGGHQLQAAVVSAADDVAALRGVRAGRRTMVRQAIVDMFLAM